jgi:membrane protease subunit HflC
VLALSAFFTVDQTEQPIVMQFGEFKRAVRDPGLHVKLPFVQNVVYYDRRVLDADAGAQATSYWFYNRN